MNNKNFKLGVVIITMMVSVLGYSQTQNTRPNVVFIFVDDLGFSDVGFNRDDSTFLDDYGKIPTPQMDALAANGIIAKNAHVVHPFCGPSRAALMTGMYPHRIGAQYNIENGTDITDGIPVSETYFSKVLQDNNYNTAAIGKWHLGSTSSFIPNNRGFDYFFGMLGGGHQYFESDYEQTWINNGGTTTNDYRVPLVRNQDYILPSEFNNDEYLTNILTDEAINYINTNAADPDPFFMYLAYNAPHTPLQAPQAKIDAFNIANGNGTAGSTYSTVIATSPQILGANIPNNWTGTDQEYRDALVEDRLIYSTMVSIVDEDIGNVKDALIANNILDNTLIIFMSDNGGKRFQAGAVNIPLQQGKGSVDEGGHRVPMFFHWPNQITGGQTYDKLISSLDLYPTFVDLAGASLPVNKQIDGTTIMDAVISGASARPNESLYIMRPQLGFHNGAIMTDDYKLTKKGGGSSTWALFDAVNDIEEATNLRTSPDVLGTGQTGIQIIDEQLDKGILWVSDFQNAQPQWYDNDGGGSGHPHLALWNNGTLPAYDVLFERSLAVDVISVTAINDAVEGQTVGLFTVGLPGGILATQNIDVTYTVSGTAETDGSDYTSLSGTITILNGTNSTDIPIVASSDGLDEVSETVIIQLTATTIGSVETTPAEINIFDVISATTLTAGDIAIVGWRAGSGNNGNGAVAFMLLKDITATTKISFSTRSWSTSGWTGDYSIDDVWTWTADNNYNVGEIFMLDADGLVKRVTGDTEIVVGTTSHDHTGKISESSDGDFDISTGGEGILVYQVDPFVLPTDANSSNWITGLNTNGGWGTGGGNTFCALPTALTNGINANTVGIDQDNGVYIGAISGTVSQLRASINNSANWDSRETPNYSLWRFDATLGGAFGEIGLAGTLSVNSIENEDEVKIYPNPSEGNFTIKFNKTYNNIEIEILSISGKSIKKVHANNVNSQKINISSFSSGMYFLKIKSDDNVSIEKIMKL